MAYFASFPTSIEEYEGKEKLKYILEPETRTSPVVEKEDTQHLKVRISKYNILGNLVDTYSSRRAAARENRVTEYAIAQAINKGRVLYGHYFKI